MVNGFVGPMNEPKRGRRRKKIVKKKGKKRKGFGGVEGMECEEGNANENDDSVWHMR